MISNVTEIKTSPLPLRTFPQTKISDRAIYNETNRGAERPNELLTGVTS